MATPRSQQTSQRRVKEIAAEAARKIAAESPLDEEVVVTVEELPPGETIPESIQASSSQLDVVDTWLTTAASGQRFVAEGFNAWLDMTKNLLPSGSGSLPPFAFDPRAAVEVTFQLAEDLLAVQKETLLRLTAPLAN